MNMDVKCNRSSRRWYSIWLICQITYRLNTISKVVQKIVLWLSIDDKVVVGVIPMN